MKLTEEQIKSCLNEDGTLNAEKLADINSEMEKAMSRSFGAGVDKTKKELEAEAATKAKEGDEAKKAAESESDDKYQQLLNEFNAFKSEQESSKKEAQVSEAKKDFIERAKKANVHDDIISTLSETTSVEMMKDFNFDNFAKIEVEDIKNQNSKEDKNQEEKKRKLFVN